MAFGDKIKRTCVTCGNEFEGFPQSKYCSDTCKPKRDRNKKKEPKTEVKDETENTDNVNVVGDSGIEGTPDEPNEPKTEVQSSTKNEVNSIQIIDSNTGKKEKGIVDQVLEKLFSEDLAPITTSILASLATRLQQPNNATEEGILTAEDGSKHQMI